ncbi:hypothetical protein AJ79_09425 [Helicocarpus griseus UAMH5409]|uniref:AMP-dependent synthetase/ligase domain-containing protein n=1 Tax=Helicocarpus griseus UAMH5409 TaxID=1447875 RepID=A0A2B7WBH2_9EURO|nr:hypothetical protein AJ79_09425 [Helicocarpus griseus UAMH5409]
MVISTDPHDRRRFVPLHVGPSILPLCSLFNRMVRFAHRPHLTAVKDIRFGFTASYAQILTDVLHLRNHLRETLSPEILTRLEKDEKVFINLLGPGGYEYTVGFLAIFALGAVVVPISPDLPVKEAGSLVQRCQADGMLSSEVSVPKAMELASLVRTTKKPGYTLTKIRQHIMNHPLEPSKILISADHVLNSLVIFTSGTTGPPKGAVRRRSFLWETSLMTVDQYGLSEGAIVLHTLPVHHITGISTQIPFLLVGGCIESRSGGFSTEWTWERIRQGGLAYFSGVPTMYMRLMQYYETTLAKLPTELHDEYVSGIREFKALLCGTSALPRPLQQKWTKLRGGRSILTRYGGTEFGAGFQVPIYARGVPDGSVGVITPGVDLKLSHGDEGEILMKSPLLFSKYLFDPDATAKVHDADGYFKTGDIARREGDYYFIMGRASVDIIKSGGYKLSALDIEREILGLGYVSEVMVVGVDDEEFGQRLAAAIVLDPASIQVNEGRVTGEQSLTLRELRGDLRTTLAGYKMPTVLRVVKEIPKSATGKVQKKNLSPKMFPAGGHPEVEVWKTTSRSAKL